MRRFLPLVALVVALTLGAAACGGDDSAPSSASPTTAESATGTPGGDSSGDGGGKDTATSIDLGSGGGKFCDTSRDQLSELLTGGQEDMLSAVLPNLLDPSKSAAARAQLKDLFADLRAKNEAVLDEAPSEIRADLKTIASASYAVYDALEAAGYDFTKVDFSKLTNVTESADWTAAAERVGAYYKDRCGIDINTLGN